MALTDLIARLEQDAASQVQAIEQQAELDVRAIEAATDEALAEARARHLGQQRAERQVVWQRELASARRQARARELEARHVVLARILDRARARLPEMAASTLYRSALPSHLDEALSYLEGLGPRVRCASAFAPLFAPIVDRHEGARLVVDDSVGPGPIAEAEDGSVIVDNTLDARLARIEDRLAIDLLKELGNAGC
jgi:vacuolar-type H+-ATPase subunit E/Vma4